MTTKPRTSPEWLTKRHDTNAKKWRGKNSAPLIASTLASVKTGSVNATTSTSPIGELLRAYALVQARYDFDDREIAALGTMKNVELFDIASTWWLQELTNRALHTTSKDWNDGAGSALASHLEYMNDELELFDEACRHLFTASSVAVARVLGKKSPEMLEQIQKLKRKARKYLTEMRNPSTNLDHTDYENRPCRYDAFQVARLVEVIEEFRRPLVEKQAKSTLDGDPNSGRQAPDGLGDSTLWYPVNHAPVNLSKPHIGKIGTKRRATDSGKTLRYPSRALTDPARRVFERRARAKSALVVLDMSGSMNYTTDELDQIIEHARGAVVVGYSQNTSESPNFWTLAKDGHRVAKLPQAGNANGLDGTALTYAVKKYRKSSTTPVIWVSDGQINGIGNGNRKLLAIDMIKRLRASKATQVETAEQAIELLAKMANGHKPAHTISSDLIKWANR